MIASPTDAFKQWCRWIAHELGNQLLALHPLLTQKRNAGCTKQAPGLCARAHESVARYPPKGSRCFDPYVWLAARRCRTPHADGRWRRIYCRHDSIPHIEQLGNRAMRKLISARSFCGFPEIPFFPAANEYDARLSSRSRTEPQRLSRECSDKRTSANHHDLIETAIHHQHDA